MNQGIPKAVSDALARQVPTDEHPSADLLNGFGEQSLTVGERDRVATHLAVCADCREVVFLAGNAAPEPGAPAVITPAHGRAWWRWAIPVVAGLAMVASVLVYRQNELSRTASAPTQIASNQPAPEVHSEAGTKPGTSPVPPVKVVPVSPPESRLEAKLQPNLASPAIKPGAHGPAPAFSHGATAAHGSAVTFNRPGTFAHGPTASTGGSMVALAGHAAAGGNSNPSGVSVATANSASTEIQATPSSQTVQVASAPTSPAEAEKHASAAGANPTPETADLKVAPDALAKSKYYAAPRGALPVQAGAARVLNVRAFWRVTADGHLEREQPGAGWTRVLADQPVMFRVVSIIGTNVWAGGDKGALFHSVDGGEHWNQVVLGDSAHIEQGNVVSIAFDTVAQGTVTIDSGAIWKTADGGKTWTKQ